MSDICIQRDPVRARHTAGIRNCLSFQNADSSPCNKARAITIVCGCERNSFVDHSCNTFHCNRNTLVWTWVDFTWKWNTCHETAALKGGWTTLSPSENCVFLDNIFYYALPCKSKQCHVCYHIKRVFSRHFMAPLIMKHHVARSQLAGLSIITFHMQWSRSSA